MGIKSKRKYKKCHDKKMKQQHQVYGAESKDKSVKQRHLPSFKAITLTSTIEIYIYFVRFVRAETSLKSF